MTKSVLTDLLGHLGYNGRPVLNFNNRPPPDYQFLKMKSTQPFIPIDPDHSPPPPPPGLFNFRILIFDFFIFLNIQHMRGQVILTQPAMYYREYIGSVHGIPSPPPPHRNSGINYQTKKNKNQQSNEKLAA